MVCVLAAALAVASASAAELRIGAATINITPDKPVALDGQFNARISRGVDNPITATAVAIESREGGRAVDGAMLLSCDIVVIRPPILQPLRERLREKLPAFDPRKLVLHDVRLVRTGWRLMAGAAAVAEQGITAATMPAGTILSVKVNPLRDGSSFGSKAGNSAIAKCPWKTPPAPGKTCDSVKGVELLGGQTF